MLEARLIQKLQNSCPLTFQTINAENPKPLWSLRHVLICTPVLAVPNATSHVTEHTVTFDLQIDCVLQPEQPHSTVKQIIYWSMSITDAKRQYATSSESISLSLGASFYDNLNTFQE